jgi:hypothetical protein
MQARATGGALHTHLGSHVVRRAHHRRHATDARTVLLAQAKVNELQVRVWAVAVEDEVLKPGRTHHDTTAQVSEDDADDDADDEGDEEEEGEQRRGAKGTGGSCGNASVLQVPV